jgi:hypothetical protein
MQLGGCTDAGSALQKRDEEWLCDPGDVCVNHWECAKASAKETSGIYHYLHSTKEAADQVETSTAKEKESDTEGKLMLARPYPALTTRTIWGCPQQLCTRYLFIISRRRACFSCGTRRTGIDNQLRNDLNIVAYSWRRKLHENLPLLVLFFRRCLGELIGVACNVSIAVGWRILLLEVNLARAHHLLV